MANANNKIFDEVAKKSPGLVRSLFQNKMAQQAAKLIPGGRTVVSAFNAAKAAAPGSGIVPGVAATLGQGAGAGAASSAEDVLTNLQSSGGL